MAINTVGNRLYIADTGETGKTGAIYFVNLDGSGAGVFSAPGAPGINPEGLALDTAARTIYWMNTEPYGLAWAKLDGSVGGLLNTAGAKFQGAYRIAIDTADGRVYWGNPNGIENLDLLRQRQQQWRRRPISRRRLAACGHRGAGDGVR